MHVSQFRESQGMPYLYDGNGFEVAWHLGPGTFTRD
jgi:hypothetical protein